MSDEAMTDAEVLEALYALRGVPIDLKRWRQAVAELKAALEQPEVVREHLDRLRPFYGAAGAVMAFMTDEQQKIAQPLFAEVEAIMRKLAQ